MIDSTESHEVVQGADRQVLLSARGLVGAACGDATGGTTEPSGSALFTGRGLVKSFQQNRQRNVDPSGRRIASSSAAAPQCGHVSMMSREAIRVPSVHRLLRFFPSSMKVRLTKKYADAIDGVDLADREVGDIVDLAPTDARLLVLEGWATPDDRSARVHPADGGFADTTPEKD
jgi:hypothetical protein